MLAGSPGKRVYKHTNQDNDCQYRLHAGRLSHRANLQHLPGIKKFAVGLQNFRHGNRINQTLFCGLHEVAHESGVLGFFPHSGALTRENN